MLTTMLAATLSKLALAGNAGYDGSSEPIEGKVRLYRLGLPVRRIKLIDRYGADDHRSIAADDASAVNRRFVAGTNRWSMHACGKAIGINPVENPYDSR